jgi:pimeloyl-ACP methyl ester carboxylesterase
VIDGVVPFDNTPVLRYAASAQQSLDRVIAACASSPACGRDHPDLARSFTRLLSRFDHGPIRTTVETPDGRTVPVSMTRGDFGYAVRGALYSSRAPLTLPDRIAFAAASGDVRVFAQMYFDRHVRLSASLADGLHLSVMCAEEISPVRNEAVDGVTAGTFLGRYLFDEYRAACGAWRRGPVAPDFHTPATQGAPVLLLSGFFDPVTPPEFAARVARSLPVARTIVAPGAAHGSTTICGTEAVVHVLKNGSLEGMPAACQ